jgi:hypothetical protein
MEYEHNNKSNFLGITINREKSIFMYTVFRKTTVNSSIIHKTSCDPHQYKRAALTCLQDRLGTYRNTQDGKYNESNTIQQIEHESG